MKGHAVDTHTVTLLKNLITHAKKIDFSAPYIAKCNSVLLYLLARYNAPTLATLLAPGFSAAAIKAVIKLQLGEVPSPALLEGLERIFPDTSAKVVYLHLREGIATNGPLPAGVKGVEQVYVGSAAAAGAGQRGTEREREKRRRSRPKGERVRVVSGMMRGGERKKKFLVQQGRPEEVVPGSTENGLVIVFALSISNKPVGCLLISFYSLQSRYTRRGIKLSKHSKKLIVGIKLSKHSKKLIVDRSKHYDRFYGVLAILAAASSFQSTARSSLSTGANTTTDSMESLPSPTSRLFRHSSTSTSRPSLPPPSALLRMGESRFRKTHSSSSPPSPTATPPYFSTSNVEIGCESHQYSTFQDSERQSKRKGRECPSCNLQGQLMLLLKMVCLTQQAGPEVPEGAGIPSL